MFIMEYPDLTVPNFMKNSVSPKQTDLSALVGDVYCIFVTFPCGILGQMRYLMVSFSDLCCLSYFEFSSMQVLEYSIPMVPMGLPVEVLEEEVAVVGW